MLKISIITIAWKAVNGALECRNGSDFEKFFGIEKLLQVRT